MKTQIQFMIITFLSLSKITKKNFSSQQGVTKNKSQINAKQPTSANKKLHQAKIQNQHQIFEQLNCLRICSTKETNSK